MNAMKKLCVCLVLGGLIGACESASETHVKVTFESEGLAKRVEQIDLALLKDCPSPLDYRTVPEQPIELTTIRKGAPMSLTWKTHKAGKYALYARGVAGDCKTVAGACVPVRIASGDNNLEVELAELDALACGEMRACNQETLNCDCAEGAHLCGGVCASDTSPMTCGDRCEPCEYPKHGHATCESNACKVECDFGFDACDKGCCPGLGFEQALTFGEYPPGVFNTPPSIELAVGSDHIPHGVFGNSMSSDGQYPPAVQHVWRDNGAWRFERINDTDLSSYQSRIDVDSMNRPVVMFAEPGLTKYAVRDDNGWTTDSVGGIVGLVAFQLASGDVPTVVVTNGVEIKYGSRGSDGIWTTHVSPVFSNLANGLVSSYAPGKLAMLPPTFFSDPPETPYVTTEFVHVSGESLDVQHPFEQHVNLQQLGMACRAARCLVTIGSFDSGLLIVDYYDGELHEETMPSLLALTAPVGLSKDGSYAWIVATVPNLEEGADGGESFVGAHLLAMVKHGTTGAWHEITIARPEPGYLVYPHIAVDPEGGLHLIAWWTTTFDAPDSGPLPVDFWYAYVPVPADVQ